MHGPARSALWVNKVTHVFLIVFLLREVVLLLIEVLLLVLLVLRVVVCGRAPCGVPSLLVARRVVVLLLAARGGVVHLCMSWGVWVKRRPATRRACVLCLSPHRCCCCLKNGERVGIAGFFSFSFFPPPPYLLVEFFLAGRRVVILAILVITIDRLGDRRGEGRVSCWWW